MPTPSELIDLLGGTSTVAKLTGIKPPSVHEWRSKDTIPDDKLIRLAPLIEQVSKRRFSRFTLFPNDWHRIWPELIGTDGAPEVPPEAHVHSKAMEPDRA